METVHTAVWIEGQVDDQNVSNSIRTTVSSLAPKTRDFSMELHDIHLSDTHNYSFHLKLHGEKSCSLCTVCLTVAGKDKIFNANIDLILILILVSSIQPVYLQVISAILLY